MDEGRRAPDELNRMGDEFGPDGWREEQADRSDQVDWKPKDNEVIPKDILALPGPPSRAYSFDDTD